MKYLNTVILFFVSILMTFGQVESLSLDFVIGYSERNAFEVYSAKYNLSKIQLELDQIKTQFRPQLVLNATAPSYYNTSVSVTQPDGSLAFQSISQNSSNLNMSVTKQFYKSNTSIFVQSNLFRFDNISKDNVNYNNVPIRVGINQPINGFNTLKWNKRITEKELEVQDKVKTREVLSNRVQTVDAFFSLLASQTDIDIARTNLANNEKILIIAQERFRLGKISEDDLLQIELNLNSSKKSLAVAQRAWKQNQYLLKESTNRFDLTDSLVLEVPKENQELFVDPKEAAELAWQNNPTQNQNLLTQIRNERDREYAKRTTGFQATFEASIGLVKSADKFSELYNKLQDESLVEFRLRIPIYDGGYRKSLLATNDLDREYIQQLSQYNEANLKANVEQLVFQFNLLGKEAAMALVNYEIAQQRYDIANKRYALGNISNTDLSVAFAERDEALRIYISTLRDYWLTYYIIQEQTLFDFGINKTIQ